MTNLFLPKTFDNNTDLPFCCDAEKGKTATSIHWHSGMEIIYVEKGSAQVFFDNGWHQLPPSSLLFIPEGKLHCCRCLDENTEKTIVGFTEKCLDGNRTYKTLPLNLLEHCIITNLEVTPIPKLLHDLYGYTCQKGVNFDLKSRACIFNIFSLLLEYWQNLGVDVENSTKKSFENEIIK